MSFHLNCFILFLNMVNSTKWNQVSVLLFSDLQSKQDLPSLFPTLSTIIIKENFFSDLW